MALYNSCYSAGEDGVDEQGGNGLVGIGAMQPLVESFKKSLLSASEAVIKRLRHRQVGRKQKGSGRKKGRKQQGRGKKKKRQSKQQGRGRKKQKGKGKKCISRSK